MNFYTRASSAESVPCTQSEFDALKRALAIESHDDPSDDEEHGFELEFWEAGGSHDLESTKSSVYLFSTEMSAPENLPEKFLKLMGKLLKKAKKKHLQIGVAWTADRCTPGSHGGHFVRITPKGKLIQAELAWPKH